MLLAVWPERRQRLGSTHYGGFQVVRRRRLEGEGFVVSPAVKFPIQLQTRKATYEEMRTHGYEVDLVAAEMPKDGAQSHPTAGQANR